MPEAAAVAAVKAAGLLGRLPGEIRNHIYGFYLPGEDDFVYNFASGKLRTASDQPIHVALSGTCKLAASDMKCLLSLSKHTIVFSTVDEWAAMGTRAARFHYMVHMMAGWSETVLPRLWDCISAADEAKIKHRYPEFGLALDYILESGRSGRRVELERGGVTPSLFRLAVNYTLQLAQAHPNFVKTVSAPSDSMRDRAIRSLCLPALPPWLIPTDIDLERLADIDVSAWVHELHPRYLKKYRFSAAAAAIRFLGSIPQATRMGIRDIVLNEDRVAVPFAECHAEGLIPFCRENRDLRVQRRVSIWRNLYREPPETVVGIVEQERQEWPPWQSRMWPGPMMQTLALWLDGAWALRREGMPAGSFRMVLDGVPLEPHRNAVFFKHVHVEAGWQKALRNSPWAAGGPRLGPGFWERHWQSRGFYAESYDGFPEALQHFNGPGSLFRCEGFDFGPPWLAQPGVPPRVGERWDLENWRRAWSDDEGTWDLEDWHTAWWEDQDTFRRLPPLLPCRLLAHFWVPQLTEEELAEWEEDNQRLDNEFSEDNLP